jgi:probable O-glycosylation ligase (exosortase A-associated)
LARSFYLLFIYLAIFGLGLAAPFIFTLGYEWVDIFRPEDAAWQILRRAPVSFVMGAAAVGSYVLFDRRSPPRISAVTVLTILFGFWVTLTSNWAEVPGAAWAKWDWAFKGIMFSVFIPFVIRSRNQIEAFLQVFVFSLAANFIPFGLKSLMTGGGYARHLGLINRNFFLGEQDTLAAACVMTIPMILYLIEHTRIIPRNKLTATVYCALVVMAIATIIGSHERAAPLGLVVAAAVYWWKSRRKILFTALSALIAIFILISAPDTWWERMSTISSGNDDRSIHVRLEVWQWTLDYVDQHPFGGGFEAYRINQVEIPLKNGDTKFENGRAFHSVIFEVLGEHGWTGLGLFLAIILFSLRSLREAARLSKARPDLSWIHDLANTLQISFLGLLTCGVFITFAFHPLIYYLFALSQSLREYVRKVVETREERAPLESPELVPLRP